MHVINQEMMSRIKMRIYGHVVCAYPRLACALYLGKNCEFRWGRGHIREETEDWSEGLSTYTQIFSPKNTGFHHIKNTSQIFFDFCSPLFYATFQCGTYNIFKKNLDYFFTHEDIKKQASNVAYFSF